jgi:hypothetical protein
MFAGSVTAECFVDLEYTEYSQGEASGIDGGRSLCQHVERLDFDSFALPRASISSHDDDEERDSFTVREHVYMMVK